jgi:hypothetical protein
VPANQMSFYGYFAYMRNLIFLRFALHSLELPSAIAIWLCEKEQKRISGENGVLLVDLSELSRIYTIAYSIINFGIVGNRNKVLPY